MRFDPLSDRRAARSRRLIEQLESRLLLSAEPFPNAAILLDSVDTSFGSIAAEQVELGLSSADSPGIAKAIQSDVKSPRAMVINSGEQLTVNEDTWLRLSNEVLGHWSTFPLPIAWSQVSGPGTAEFSNPLSPDSQVRFDVPGTYDLQLTINTAGVTVWGCVVVEVDENPTGVALPELPRQQVDTTYSLPTGGQTWRVNQGDNLQAVLDAAQPGDVVELQAGATFTGNFVLRPRAGDGWIYVTTSNMTQLPQQGTRISPADAPNMAKLMTPNQFNPALIIEPGVKNFRFVGIDITTAYAVTTGVQYGVVRIGWDATNGGALTGPAAENIVFDRCFIHGTPTGNIRDGIVTYNVKHLAIVDSYLNDFHGIGQESHGIQVYNSPGPVKIQNNYIEAGGINVFIGDNGSGLNPSDIEVIGNYLYKSRSWDPAHPSYAGTPWLVKNLLEVKAGSRILIEGNRMENSWVGAQHGDVIVLTPRGGAVSDVTIRKNVARNFWSGVTINNADVTLDRVLLEDNIFSNVLVPDGTFIKMAGNPGRMNHTTIRHNTLIGNGAHNTFLAFYGSSADEIDGLVFYDNLVTQGTYGISGNGVGVGYAAVNHYTKNFDFRSNAVIGGDASYFGTPTDHWQDWRFPSTMAGVGFTDTTFDNISDFKLVTSSTLYRAGSDGRDIGANIDAILSVVRDVF